MSCFARVNTSVPEDVLLESRILQARLKRLELNAGDKLFNSLAELAKGNEDEGDDAW